MRTLITSDIHLGAKQSRASAFLAFLASLHPDDRLILNGDVVTHFANETTLPSAHLAVLDKLRALSAHQEIIWIRGNNDRYFDLTSPGRIRFATDARVDGILYVTHGDRFDHLMPALRFALIPLRVVYEFCTRVVGSKTHVASFAKRFPAVYNVLNGHVARNAIRFARSEQLSNVTCGHTHHPEIREHDGVRYFNTGCWTENAERVLIVKDKELLLCDPAAC